MNKRSVISTLLFVAAAALVVCFGVLLWQDYTVRYQYGSAPFYLYVAERVIECLLPSVVCLVVGGVIKKQPEQERTSLKENDKNERELREENGNDIQLGVL